MNNITEKLQTYGKFYLGQAVKHEGEIGKIYYINVVKNDYDGVSENEIWLGVDYGVHGARVNSNEVEIISEKNKSDGGPSSYYNVFPKDIKTANDIIEHMSVNIWKEYSCHMKDVFKAITRWGTKEGTSIEYDSKKLIYSGVRLYRMIAGNTKTREYLQDLLNDEQFED